MALPNASPIVKVYYGKPVLPEVSRVLACLYEKDFQLVAFQNVDCMPVDLIRLQASTSVPAPFFEDGSKFLFESRAICRYISETYADRGSRYLLGRDLLDRVSIEQWLKSEEQSFDPPSRALVLHLAFPPSSKSYNELLEESDRLAKILDVYDHRLGESRYLAGDEFTLADLTHLPNSQYIATSKEWGHLFDERENVKRWWEDVSTRPSWSQVAEEIRKREEDDEEEEEEMAQEVDEYFIGISRPPPKTSLKASIFQPIEASEQFSVKPKTTYTVSKKVASPTSSVQVTVPDRKAFSVSAPAIKGAPSETAKIQSHSTVDSDKTVTQPGDASAKTKQPVTDAKVRMENSTIPPTGKQVPSTAHIDKTNTKPPGAASQYTMPVTDAKVTMEEAAITPTGTQESSTAHIDKASTKPTGGASQSTMPVTDDKVTRKQSAIPPTGTQVPSTAPIDKASTKPTGVTPQSRMPVTDTKVTTEESAIPPTNTQVPSTAGIDKASTKATGVEKTFFPQPKTEAPPTSKMVPPTKPSLEGTKAPPTEKNSTKTPSKGQGQITTTDSKWGQAGEERTSKEEEREIDEKAYLAAKHKEWEEQWQEPEKFGEEKYTNSIQVEKPKPPKLIDSTPTISSETARQEPVTESRTTTKSKDDTLPAATQGSGHGKTSETSPAPTATSQASLSNFTDETQGGVTNKTNNILDPKPPKNEGTTPLATPTPAAETTPQTATPKPMTNKLTTAPEKDPPKSTVRDIQKEPSPGKTTTKPQDTSQAVTALKTTIPDATKQPPPPSTSGIGNKSNNLPTQSPTATFPTATPEPMTNTPNTAPAPETSKSTDPAAKENSSQRVATNEQKETMPSTPESATFPATSQKSSSETTANTNNLPKQSPTATSPTVTAGPMTDTPNTVPAPVTSKPADPAAKENFSRKAATKEPKETTSSAPESAIIPAASQKYSSETAGKSQASPTTEQTPPNDEVASEIINVSQPRKAPARSQSENISQNLGDDITKRDQVKTDLTDASTGTKLDNGSAQTSQIIAQKTPPANEAPRKTAATPNTEKARSGDEIGIVRTEDEATPIQTPSKEIQGVPPETSDIEKTRSVDEIGTERTKGEASPIQTPPKDTSTEGVPSTQTTPSDKEQSTREQISNGTTLEAKAPSSNDEQGSEVTRDKNSFSMKENETQSRTKMESKTETDKSGTSKSNQTDITQPNKFNDATTRNETLSEANQNVASQQDKEGTSSNESSTKSPTKQNSEPDSINEPGPANNNE